MHNAKYTHKITHTHTNTEGENNTSIGIGFNGSGPPAIPFSHRGTTKWAAS